MIRTTHPDGSVTVQFTAEEYTCFAATKLDGIADDIKLHDLQARCPHEWRNMQGVTDLLVCRTCGKTGGQFGNRGSSNA